MSLFKLTDFSYNYPETSKAALRSINLQINEGDFVLLAGPSGGGKSTLLRLFGGFIPYFYGGRISGEFIFQGKRLTEITKSDFRSLIGMVFQDPEKQIIMNSVERDLAFGLENLQKSPDDIHKILSETSELLGLNGLMNKRTDELSSGQKQKIAIASIIAMQTKVLILDEPTSQLDVSSSREIISLLKRLHKKGFTIILTEHRLEHCIPAANKILFLDKGSAEQYSSYEDFKDNLPAGRRDFLVQGLADKDYFTSETRNNDSELLNAENLEFSYNGTKTLHGVNIKIKRGEFVSILGENGAGKTTLSRILSGLLKPHKGTVFFEKQDIYGFKNKGKVGYLSQNPNDYLFSNSVEAELKYTMNSLGIKDSEYLEFLLDALKLKNKREEYPRELSAGERQRVALGAVLAGKPEVLILDEPTRGIDPILKRELGELLCNLVKKSNTSVILVTQDVDFAFKYTSRTIILSRGKTHADGIPCDYMESKGYLQRISESQSLNFNSLYSKEIYG